MSRDTFVNKLYLFFSSYSYFTLIRRLCFLFFFSESGHYAWKLTRKCFETYFHLNWIYKRWVLFFLINQCMLAVPIHQLTNFSRPRNVLSNIMATAETFQLFLSGDMPPAILKKQSGNMIMLSTQRVKNHSGEIKLLNLT